MEFTGINGVVYRVGRTLGQGGEGIVYDLPDHPTLVLKHYLESLKDSKRSKLQQMVSMHTPSIETYAAWPRLLVKDTEGHVCGFVMKKLAGFLPLHMAFSPMERKKLFPDKGYNFLAHIARNLVSAFHKIHETGLVVGDVNEGNILINSAGLVTFIDCDSFQVRGVATTWYCEVGVPRYTAPELLRQASFGNLERTANTDIFSMAVLVFQLLFLGRHPFAGINNSSRDLDEEAAIKEHEFAYSTHRKHRALYPPDNALQFDILPLPLQLLFHQAFETETRPSTTEWLLAIDELLQGMVTCNSTKLHTYPIGVAECPWCQFKEKKGILYFLDDTFLLGNQMQSDVDRFVNGFKISDWEIAPWVPIVRQHHANGPLYLTKWTRVRQLMDVIGIVMVGWIVLCYYMLTMHSGTPGIEGVSFCVIVFFLMYFGIRRLRHNCKKERTRLADTLATLLERQTRLVAGRDGSKEIEKLNSDVEVLALLVNEYKSLRIKEQEKVAAAEEQHYESQLIQFLSAFPIDDYDIPGIGNALKNALRINGILTAGHIHNLRGVKVAGFGPKKLQAMLDWQRTLSVNFTYQPDLAYLDKQMEKIKDEMLQIRRGLELSIKTKYREITAFRNSVKNALLIKDLHLNQLNEEVQEAEWRLSTFQNVVRMKRGL